MGEVMVGWMGSTVFDVSTGHLFQVKATVYVFLSVTCRGEFPVIFFWGRGSFCLGNQSPPYIITPTPISHSLAFKAPQWLRDQTSGSLPLSSRIPYLGAGGSESPPKSAVSPVSHLPS